MFKWNEIDADKYNYALEVLPPATMTGLGFLLGEPTTHGTCPVTGNFGALFDAYAKVGSKYFVADKPMTVRGFHRCTHRDLYPRTVA